ncbi:MAG: hypothetical protein M0024_06235 [Nitrospiraceae bacterium]|nr:hypothetical protein [Nitrospiraceae bacterium]
MMNRMFGVFFCLVTLVMASLPAGKTATACQVDAFFLTKAGHIAGATPAALGEATGLQERGDQDKLAERIKEGVVVRLQENIRVQALERSFDPPMIKIKFPDNSSPFWVTEGSLKRINSPE